MNKKRFEQGQTYTEFLNQTEEHRELYKHHYEKTNIDEKDIPVLSSLNKLYILALTLPQCGDSIAVLPVIQKMFQDHKKVELRLINRDENPDIMDMYLTNGGRAVPKLAFFDEHFNELGQWGPRPRPLQELFESYRPKIHSGEISKIQVHQILRREYSKDRGRIIIKEINDLLKKAIP